jgi:hypothetical protein
LRTVPKTEVLEQPHLIEKSVLNIIELFKSKEAVPKTEVLEQPLITSVFRCFPLKNVCFATRRVRNYKVTSGDTAPEKTTSF